ncbi:MAG TPA: ABC transporter substrate-binding protein [Acidimicrobiia bacterium]|nr:ABC transporter substrate-binding protein [Acidimicrobiia bacterium]
MKHRSVLILLVLAAMLLAACGDGSGATTTLGEAPATTAGEAPATTAGGTETTAAPEVTTGELIPVRLQLQWVTQAQFAGYFAAIEQGFYTDEGLDVTILEGAVDIVPQQVVAAGGAEFGLAWVPKALVSREEGANLVNIGQVFQRSGTLEVSWADAGITTPEDWEGKRVGTWGFGNEFELTAAFEKFGVEPGEIVQQPFDMSLLLNREIDAAQAMTYNEYAQVLEAVNPDTGELYTPEDLAVIDFNDPAVGTAMLQDAIWADAGWLADNEETASAFLRASFRGWIFCRDNPDDCVQIVLDRGSTLGPSHQAWQMNEINALIWPSPGGIGVMDEALWAQTVEVAVSQGVISADPGSEAYRSDLAAAAVADLEAEGLDVTGESWEKTEVTLNEGGE